MTSFRRSLAISFAGRYSGLVINLGSNMVLSRILTPTEIGLYSISIAIVGFAHVLRDFGVPNYIIQERELTEERLQTTFGIALLSSFLFGAVLALTSGYAADFYHDQHVRSVILVLSLNFVIIPFGSLAGPICVRDMMFATIYYINLSNLLVYTAVALGMAFMGYGAISMAWAAVAGNVATTLASYVFRPEQIKLRPSLKAWRHVAHFSLFSAGTNLVAEFGNSAPNLILGRFLGFFDVGLYSKANGFVTMFNDNVMAAIRPVVVSKLAISHRSNLELRREYMEMQAFQTVISLPFLAFAIPMMLYVMRFLFGSQWDAAVPIAQILCVATMINAVASLNWSIFTAIGAVQKSFRSQLVIVVVKVGLIFYAGSLGLTPVAISVTAVSLAAFAITTYHLRSAINVSVLDMAVACSRSVGIAVVALAVGYGVDYFSRALLWGEAHTLVVGAIAGTSVWLAGVFAFNHPIRREIEIMTRGTFNGVAARFR